LTTAEPAASSSVPVLTRAANAAANWSARWVPNAFVIACLLTLVVFALVIAVAGKNPIAAQGYWVKGFWELLELAMQMSLIVLTGYVVAVSPAVSRLLESTAGLATTTTGAVVLMGLVSMGASWLHWGLGLIAGPTFLQFLVRKHPRIDYRLAVAAGYLGSTCTWHAGLSGSAPLLMATPKNFMEAQAGLIPISTTTFSAFNLILTAVIVVVMSVTLRRLYPRDADVMTSAAVIGGSRATVEELPVDPHAHGRVRDGSSGFSLADAIEHRYALNLVMGLLGLSGAWTLYVHGIVVQFPFYAGMYGLIRYSGLAETIGHWFVSIASPRTFPVIIYWYSGVLSYFIPSGGSKWAVEAPYVVSAAQALAVPIPHAILAYAWGDMSTHFLQPFWAIPLLAIARVEFKDIVGYLALLFVVNLVVVSTAFLLLPYIW
jgi:short-chain fatty acids transporter